MEGSTPVPAVSGSDAGGATAARGAPLRLTKPDDSGDGSDAVSRSVDVSTDAGVSAQALLCVSADETGGALRELYRAYAGELYRFAVNALADRGSAEEIVHDVFTHAWRHADAYDPSCGSVRAWLFEIARHAIIDRRGRFGVRPARASDDAAGMEDSDACSTDRTMLGWQVAAALERLTPEHREIIRLAHHLRMPSREIAQRLGLPEGTVRSRTCYALRSLRLVLEELGVRA